jgi:phosphoenolpyruvate carboxylase
MKLGAHRAYRALLPEARCEAVAPAAGDMPYRQLLNDLMRARLQRRWKAAEVLPGSPEAFIDDLELIDAAWPNRGDPCRPLRGARVLWRARTFGFHMAALDVRQDSSRARRCAGRAGRSHDWEQRGIGGRARDRLLR